jgi:CelD/BcsL family acetyltransferase involved in cellulose biosynthesis
MTDLNATFIADDRALDALVEPWWQLWRRREDGTPFQCPAWLVPWWQAFRPGRLSTVAVHDGGDLVGMAPLYREERPDGDRLLPLGISLSDRLDILAAPGKEAEVCAAIGEALTTCAGWTNWCMPELPSDALTRSVVPHATACRWSTGSACPVLPLTDPDGLANVPADKRRKLRMSRHRLGRAASARIVSGLELEPDEWSDHLEHLHGARWRGRGETGVLADRTAIAFQRRALRAMVDAGVARLYGLELDGRMIGVYYGFLHGGVAYAYLGGFDPAAAWYGPGTLLIGHAITEAHREGGREFDLLRGREPYKYAWGAADRMNASLWVKRVPAITPAA